MRSDLRKQLTRVFSILPEDRVDAAVAATLQRLEAGSEGEPPVLKWANFDEMGRYLRGGLTSLGDNLTRLVADPAQDPDLAALAREAAEGAAQPGRLICGPDRARFYMFLPDADSSPSRVPVPIVRGFVVEFETFKTVLGAFSAERRLTDSERRVAFQLVAGIGLREAARLDGVGIETKRAQIKSAASKMQCSGQVDLVRTLMGQLSYVLALADSEAQHTRFAEGFVERHLRGDATLTVERLPGGRILRSIEAGPRDGRPVLVVHGMMFGMLLSGTAGTLHRLGLRLIMPLRLGYLDPRPVVDIRKTRRLVAESLSDLAALVRRRTLAPVTVLGHSLGAAAAIRLAATEPDLVSSLVLVSPNFVGTGGDGAEHAGRLYGGYRSFAESATVNRAVTLEFSRHYPDENAARTILERMFGGAPADRSVLEGAQTGADVYRWFPDLYASSVSGISEDYEFAQRLAPALERVVQPVLIVHGTEDPLTPLAEMSALTRAWPRAGLVPIEGAGHFASASHRGAVWEAVAGAPGRDLQASA